MCKHEKLFLKAKALNKRSAMHGICLKKQEISLIKIYVNVNVTIKTHDK